ncbi:MAG: LuxR C-terminal-related transcriptional regulator [Rubrivivax sp.]
MADAASLLHHELRFAHVASGARIAWARSGRFGAPVLVRLAHWMTHVEHDRSSPIWRPWLERLGRALELVRYDERGCGLSGPDDVPVSLESALEELDVVVQARAAPRVALLGISGAAAPAVAYAVRHPERVSHLVLLGGYLAGMMHHDPKPEHLAYHEARLRLVELGWGRNDPAVQAFFTTTFIPEATREEVAALNEQQRLSASGARVARILRARVELDVRALAPQVRVPTLVLHASDDRTVPIEAGRELAAAIPGARFESLDSRNHYPLASSPCFDRFCELVTSFVADAGASAPRLTPRERQLAELLAQGLDNLQIAARLVLAEKTVRNATSALYVKLGVDGRSQAIVRARELGFGAG